MSKKQLGWLSLFVIPVLAWMVAGLLGHAQSASINIALVVLSVGVYAAIGFLCRTSHTADYFVASRSIPPFVNGLATAADWMSAASFIGLTGILMTLGFTGDGAQNGGLIYLLGWTGGFVILATVFAGKVNAYGAYSIPELLEKRFGGRAIRWMAALGTFVCSGVYLVAQIYGIGLVTSLLSGMTFELGVFLALGGVLLCSFLGGMRAITWTQVVQCAVIVLVMLVVAVMASIKLSGHPFVPASGSAALQLAEERSLQIRHDPGELEVQKLLRERSNLALSEKAELRPRYDVTWLTPAAVRAKQVYTPEQIMANERQEALDRIQRPVGFAGHADEAGDFKASDRNAWLNGLALVFCLMVGTASLPHIVVRSMTTPTPSQARQSIVWAMVFVVLVYVCACSLAIMAKSVVLQELVGASYDNLPAWANQLRFKKLGLLHLNDLNHDGIVQFAEIGFYSDYLILGVPEVLGLPSFLLGLLAVGAMAAALSTADGLLLTISNALAHDGYYAGKSDKIDPIRKVMVSKILLLLVALIATWIAAHRSVNILSWISYAFSLAAATFFPVMVLGLCWEGTTRRAALAAMLTGLLVTAAYMTLGNGWLGRPYMLLGIDPMAGGVFGVAAGLLVGWVWSLVEVGQSDSKSSAL
jgi:cation/acetate symporter